MNRQRIGRIVAVLLGAAVLFVLEQTLHVSIYIAVPAAIAVYVAIKLAFELTAGTDKAP